MLSVNQEMSPHWMLNLRVWTLDGSPSFQSYETQILLFRIYLLVAFLLIDSVWIKLVYFGYLVVSLVHTIHNKPSIRVSYIIIPLLYIIERRCEQGERWQLWTKQVVRVMIRCSSSAVASGLTIEGMVMLVWGCRHVLPLWRVRDVVLTSTHLLTAAMLSISQLHPHKITRTQNAPSLQVSN